MSWDYDNGECEFAAAVAAAAFAIYSLEGAEAKYRRGMSGQYEKLRTEIRTRKEDTRVGITRHSSVKEIKDAGQYSTRKPSVEASASRKPSRSASIRPMPSTDQRQKGNSMKSNAVENKVDSWEKAQLRKISKRYEKMKSEILDWETAKKMEANLHMEKKKVQNELEMRKIRNMQHYRTKVDRIEAVAGGAKGQLEEKRRNQESEVKEKAKYMRSKGKNPVNCFCC